MKCIVVRLMELAIEGTASLINCRNMVGSWPAGDWDIWGMFSV